MGTKKITIKEKYVFIVVVVQLEIFNFNFGDIHRGIHGDVGEERLRDEPKECLRRRLFYSIPQHSIKHSGMENKIYEVSCLFMAICLIRVSASHVISSYVCLYSPLYCYRTTVG